MSGAEQYSSLLIGDRLVRFRLPPGRLMGELAPAARPALTDLPAAVAEALARPHGMERHMLEGFRSTDTVCIVFPDWTRHYREGELLAPLIAELEHRGIDARRIRLLCGGGTHRRSTPEELREKLGAGLYDRFQALGNLHVHDCDATGELAYLGTTSRGTPVKLNRVACEADRVILVGGIVPHYFAGYGGGRKAVIPGIAGRETIAANHGLNLDPHEDRIEPGVDIGRLEGNPIAEDMLEAARMLAPSGILNVVLNREREIAGIFAGDLEVAFLAGCRFAAEQFFVPLEERADLVIGAAGPARDWVQSHKCLYNIHRACKPDGIKVLVAPCSEGIGNDRLIGWLRLGEPRRVLARLRVEAEINGQTAFSTLTRGPGTVMVTELPAETVAAMKMTPARTVEQALELAAARLRERGIAEPSILVLPDARYTVPMPRG
jgi:nickel-dependent lactate racemase